MRAREFLQEEYNLYHGTTKDFDPSEFNTDPENEMGAHFGTPSQANHFSSNISGRNIPVTVDIKNPYQAMDDIGRWSDVDLWKKYLYQWEYDGNGPLDPSEDEIESLKTPQDVRDLLISRGYDGIVYPNRVEGDKDEDDMSGNDSYIAFYPHQIKSKFAESDTANKRNGNHK